MNVYRHELRMYRKSMWIWMLSLSLVTVLFMSMYPSFATESKQLLQLLNGYPEPVRKAFGISESLFTLLGYYCYMFTYIALCGAIQAMNVGLSLLSKETREKTADFLLTKPITRSHIVTSKLLAGVTVLVSTNVVYIIVAFVTAIVLKTEAFSVQTFFLISLSLFFIQCLFFTFAFCLSVFMPKIKSIIGVSLGTVFAFYAMSMLSSVLGDKVINYMTPFKYFDGAYILEHGSYEWKFVFISIAIVCIGIITSYFVYKKKDIHAV